MHYVPHRPVIDLFQNVQHKEAFGLFIKADVRRIYCKHPVGPASEEMVHWLSLLLVLVIALSPVRSAAIPVENAAEMVPENRAASTFTRIVTTTAEGTTTSVLS